MKPFLVGQLLKKSDEILEKIEQDRNISSHDIAYELNSLHQTVLNHLQKAGFKKNLDVWVPHESNVKNNIDRLNIWGHTIFPKRHFIESSFCRN